MRDTMCPAGGRPHSINTIAPVPTLSGYTEMQRRLIQPLGRRCDPATIISSVPMGVMMSE